MFMMRDLEVYNFIGASKGFDRDYESGEASRMVMR